MRQKDLIDLTASHLSISKEQASKHLESIFGSLAKALREGDGKVPVAGVGTFHIKETKARTGRNPSTGAPIEIPARKKVTFKASSELMTALNGSPDDEEEES